MPLVELPEFGRTIQIDGDPTEDEINRLIQNEIGPALEKERQQKRTAIEAERSALKDVGMAGQFPGALGETFLSGPVNPVNWPGIVAGTVRSGQEAAFEAMGGEPGTLPTAAEDAAALAEPTAEWLGNALNYGQRGKGALQGVLETGYGLVLGSPEFAPAIAASAAAGPAAATTMAASFATDMLSGSKEALDAAREAGARGDKREAAKLYAQAGLSGAMGLAIPLGGAVRSDVLPAIRRRAEVGDAMKDLEMATRQDIPVEAAQETALLESMPRRADEVPLLVEGRIGGERADVAAEIQAAGLEKTAAALKGKPEPKPTEVKDATETRPVEQGGVEQRAEAEAGGIPAEAGRGNRPVEGRQVETETVKPSLDAEALEKLNPIRPEEKPAELSGKPEVKLDDPAAGGALMIWPGLTSVAREGFPPDPVSLFKRFGTGGRGLTKGAERAWDTHQGAVSEGAYRIRVTSKDLLDAVQKVYKLKKKDLNRVPVTDIRVLNQALRTPPDSKWVNALPEPFREPIRNMRRHLTEMSRYLVDNNLVEGDLAVTISNNFDTWVHRSYRAHDDPKWFWDSIPDRVREDAILDEMTQNSVNRETAERTLRAYLVEHKEAAKPHPKQGGKPGSMDLNAFRAKQDVREPLRKLLGEYEDPFVNYAKSAAFLTKYIADKEFLRKVRSDGVGRYLFEEGTQPPGFDYRIAPEEGSVLEPLNGLMTDRTTKIIFDEFNRTREIQGLHKAYLMLVGFGKFGKIVGSLQTQSRNALQFFFWVNNGFGPASWLKKTDVGAGAKSPLTQGFHAVINEARSMSPPEWSEFTREAIRDRLIGDSAIGGEIRRVINTSKTLNLDQVSSPFEATPFLVKSIKAGFGAAEKAYQIPDAFGKVVGRVMETKRQQWMHPDMSLAEAKQIAAERVRNGYPSFSKLPRIVKWWQRNIPMFNFVPGFTYEIMRTQAWSAWYGAKDILEGTKTGNQRQVLAGAQRIAGIMAVDAIISQGAQAFSRWITGVSKEDDEESRRMSPDYEQNSARIYTDKGNGKLSYINFSFSNPYPISDAVIAGLRAGADDESIVSAILTAVAEPLRPWVEEAPLSKTLIEAKTGKRKVGDREIPLWNPQMSDAEKFSISLEHIWANALEPGTMTRVRKKLIPALRAGERKTAAGLVASEITGVKIQTQDLREQLGFQAKEFTDITREVSQLFTGKIWRKAGATPEELLAAYQEQEQKRFELWDSLYGSVNILRHQGVKDPEIAKILKDKNVGVNNLNAIMNGRYIPWTPTDSAMQGARDKGITVPVDAIRKLMTERSKLVLTRGIK